ncbi:matrixin family metalloprotease [bacterium]|nr:matrixin family metalloprotease [bacterium]
MLALLGVRLLRPQSAIGSSLPSQGYVLPVDSRQLVVTIQPLVPSAQVQALLPADSASLAAARELAASPAGLQLLCDGLEELYPFSYRVAAESLRIPDSIFDFERQQYDTSELLDWLKTQTDPSSFRTAGVLYCDVYDEGYNFLFGQARIAGPVCVISSNRMGREDSGGRLSPFERWRNIVRHELGHTLGLQHVDDRDSVMAFGNSLAELDSQGAELTKSDWKRLEELHPIRWDGR